ncbi:MAG: acyl-CoA thioesterase [Planctomycetes bacterium]|nr:acyl-CoA thioesterase [Planctomycetota bacterium]MBI3835793.1 acyl-CoA thioesterase [Planctomycetota bacterium]
MPGEFSIKRRIQFAETDMAGVLHFSNYFRLMEEVEHEFWRSVGLTVYMRDSSPHISWPRVSVQCEYIAPLRFEDEVDLRFVVTRVGSKSFHFEVEFVRDDEKCAHGRITAVCCATGPGGEFSATEIPKEIRSKLENVLQPVERARSH